ncbi:RNA polymerase sigma-70 factor [Parapedobacter indicus]|uniref:RNA polymerase sigma-70 factor, ECF subfamily n=1 Tax=Parapedobacter indicus TaxID=1477437 RepID=A0A1I3LKZ8_9SPHI|nr:RNA polymerase sigma-70 factor [Parapedobacter indicus]PPL01460.1 RNA polymerase sigma-70 factor (ECF subfamily) [Parapedobacter indicus]SFI85146.1 RNA polymerase sigma-70 factor, ECF subfamily [Parapedobacter indicus]
MIGMFLYDEQSDRELVTLIRESDEKAFAALYKRYNGVLFLHARRLLEDEDEAKDALQELFTKFWIKRQEIEIRSSLSAYLYAALRNQILATFSHKKVMEKYIDSLQQFLEEGQCMTDDWIREKELREQIEKEVALLPAKMRKVFELSRSINLSYKEIAFELDISDKTVKKQMNNALRILKHKIYLVLAFLLFF